MTMPAGVSDPRRASAPPAYTGCAAGHAWRLGSLGGKPSRLLATVGSGAGCGVPYSGQSRASDTRGPLASTNLPRAGLACPTRGWVYTRGDGDPSPKRPVDRWRGALSRPPARPLGTRQCPPSLRDLSGHRRPSPRESEAGSKRPRRGDRNCATIKNLGAAGIVALGPFGPFHGDARRGSSGSPGGHRVEWAGQGALGRKYDDFSWQAETPTSRIAA
jgi:hypothetical protein